METHHHRIHFWLKVFIFIWLVGSIFMFFKQQFEDSGLCREYKGQLFGWYWCSQNSYYLEPNTPPPQHLTPILWPVEVIQSYLPNKEPSVSSTEKPAQK